MELELSLDATRVLSRCLASIRLVSKDVTFSALNELHISALNEPRTAFIAYRLPASFFASFSKPSGNSGDVQPLEATVLLRPVLRSFRNLGALKLERFVIADIPQHNVIQFQIFWQIGNS
eukprot:Selendium_serpulae@DN5276_c0_g1_i1.p1